MRKINSRFLLSSLFIIVTLSLSYGQGARYTGDYEKSSPVSHVRKKNLVFDGLEFINNDRVRCIELYDCDNVTIKNCRFVSPYKQAIYLYGCKNVIIEDCTFENVNFALKVDSSQGVRFNYNDVLNITGYMYSDDPGGNDFGGMVQFISVSGANNSISFNVCENIPGECDVEDIINTYGNSGGTVDSPILIKGNWIRGGGHTNSGSGIVIGDYGGSNTIVEDNILVNPGQIGIGIAGGQNMVLRNNKVYSKRMPNTNVGMYVFNWTEDLTGAFRNIVAENNNINFTSSNGSEGNWWIPDLEKVVKGKETNVYDRSLSESILPAKIFGRARNSPVQGSGGDNDERPGNNSDNKDPDNDSDDKDPDSDSGDKDPDSDSDDKNPDNDSDDKDPDSDSGDKDPDDDSGDKNSDSDSDDKNPDSDSDDKNPDSDSDDKDSDDDSGDKDSDSDSDNKDPDSDSDDKDPDSDSGDKDPDNDSGDKDPDSDSDNKDSDSDSDNKDPDSDSDDKDPDDDTGINDTNNPEVDSETENQPEPEQTDVFIVIYLDTFKRICVNCKGCIYENSNVVVTDETNTIIHNQSLARYHTILKHDFRSGTYNITVEDGDKTQSNKITIK